MAKSKGQKRAEAETRKTEYDNLLPEQKLARAQSRRGESKKEVARIHTKIDGGGTAELDKWFRP